MLEYSQTLSKYFVEHVQLLKKYFGITQLVHFRVYFDNTYFLAGSDHAFIKEYIAEIKESKLFVGEFLRSKADDFQLILWPKKPTHYSMDFYINHGYWNGLTILQKKEDSIRGWEMLGDVNSPNINDVYREHSEALIDFIRYFDSRFNKLLLFKKNLPQFIKRVDWHNILNYSSNNNEIKIESFYRELNSKKTQVLNANKELIILTRREIECLRYLSLGKTQKEIGSILDISQRTIESYLNKVKHKACVSNKSKLIDLYNTHFIPTRHSSFNF